MRFTKVIAGLLILGVAMTLAAPVLGMGKAPTKARAVVPKVPIAINKASIKGPGTKLVINFAPDPKDVGGWFVAPGDPANADTLKGYIDGTISMPVLDLKDNINLFNGVATSALQALKEKWILADGHLETVLPVVDVDQFNQSAEIVDFVWFEITWIDSTGGDKSVEGIVIK